jgi:predicted AAA+ superfamily ATPase
LLYVSKEYELHSKKALKANPKLYIADSGIRNSVIMMDDILTSPEEMGIVAETAVFNHVKNRFREATVGYFHQYKDKEIDITVHNPKENMLIEVKYRENMDMKNEAITKLATDETINLLITKNSNDYGKLHENHNVFRIPAFIYCYLIG